MEEYYRKVKSAMLAIGFSEDEADKQLADITQITEQSLVEKILTDNPESKDSIAQDVEGFIKQNYNEQEIKDMVSKIAGNIVTEYMEEITKDLPEEKLKLFFDKINA